MLAMATNHAIAPMTFSPASINIDSLPFTLVSERHNLPHLPGIYICIADDKTILYIGRSTDIAKRWINHTRRYQLEQIGNVRIAWIIIYDNSSLSKTEATLIDYFKPALNIRLTGKSVTRTKSKPKTNLHARVSPSTPTILGKIARELGFTYGEGGAIGKMLDAIADGTLIVLPKEAVISQEVWNSPKAILARINYLMTQSKVQ